MMEGVAAMKSHREEKITLRTYKVEAAPLPKVDSKLIRGHPQEAALFTSCFCSAACILTSAR